MPPPGPAPDSHSHRACDRCRRKKAKCDSIDYSCTECCKAGDACTFDIPPGTRGPKGKPRRRGITDLRHVRNEAQQPQQSPIAASPLSPFLPPIRHTAVSLPHHLTVLERFALLASDIAQVCPFSTSLDAVVRECTDLFFQYIAPISMSVHEPSVRNTVNQALGTAPPGASPTLSAFSLLTAVCAKVCFFVPSNLFPIGSSLAETFLEASRSSFSSHADADLEDPCADSITIRLLHSNCLHTSAQTAVSWHVFGEAVRLVQRMHLHDEETYTPLSPIEAGMRRNAFWQVYIGDKSLAVLRSMPVSIHSYSFDESITTAYPLSDRDELNPGFNAGIQLWQYAADLLLRLRVIKSHQEPDVDAPHPSLTPADRAVLSQLYVRFATCLDDLSPQLLPESASSSGTSVISTHDRFAVQVADLHVTYHCLKMYLVRKLEEVSFFFWIGESHDMLVLRKTEIGRDMVRLLQVIPFWSLQINGEPCAEKIRLVATDLLAILQDPSPLATRARRDFAVLLDILSQLDSKASNALHRELP
ncbi:hypothetical protein BU23DRAFT_83631 [Bimuria novae-zelandiae CBS 107.79]|uniref:Zn(2)-C6 fungal-type domain-containing protein n=1 Tax=Bimuria novae-zelandiae CBS 107.79 TaxID=1447943 RepID=A0A6A5USF9_9PLEO|nr:hypothetical protein BU23DRAFT_83631 [Bimuria novae-zelandiae CBS 107.79]